MREIEGSIRGKERRKIAAEGNTPESVCYKRGEAAQE